MSNMRLFFDELARLKQLATFSQSWKGLMLRRNLPSWLVALPGMLLLLYRMKYR